MKKTTLSLLLCFVSFVVTLNISAQDAKPISFQGITLEMPDNISDFSWEQLSQSEQPSAGYYMILQFANTPSQEVQNQFRSRNIELTNYIEASSYFVFIPTSISKSFLETSGVISIIRVPSDFKMSSKVRNGEIGEWVKQGNNVMVNLRFHTNFSISNLVSELNSIDGANVIQYYTGSNLTIVSTPYDKINQILDLPSVKWVEWIPEPDVKDDDRGQALHRSSSLDTQTLTGRNITGEGIGVMVRDDGIVGPHIDFQGRIDNSRASGTDPNNDHGDGVAGIMGGAGNLNPTFRGMAAGSNVFVVNYVSNFLDAATVDRLNSGEVQITNSSFSNGCNAGYTGSANTVDSQSNTIPTILHVFSAGNSNNNNCGYGAGSQWGNITGGHKQGKNVIATANTFFNGQLENSSSRGPAYDGRIKPDITAHGQGQGSTEEDNTYMSFGGTSAAAPSLAGVAAQLYQVYKEENAGELPEGALIKAAILNTANDYGNVGPDFRFGWGMVNALRAAMLLEDERYLDDELAEGEANNHVISIPANTVQVRFMLYWSDPAAVAGATTALVNDLDLKVTTPTNAELLPWILDPTPNATTLNNPATNGVDRLNNMEQVLINSPDAGDYTIDVSAFNIPVGPQKYYIVYEIITEELKLIFPNGGEKLVPGESMPIHWDAVNTTESFDLEYSTDNGATWTSIATASSSETNYNWEIPSNISGECLVRITSGSFTDQSDDNFSIAQTVTGTQITQVCPTELTVTWNSVTDATEYDVYLLGEKYMEVVGTTSDTTFDIPIDDPVGSFWVAVSAKGSSTNWESRRSVARNITTDGLFNCTLNDDLSVTTLNNDLNALSPLCTGNNDVFLSANIKNLGVVAQSGFTVSYQLDDESIVNETFTGNIDPDQEVPYIFTTPLVIDDAGDHTIKVWVDLTDDEYAINDGIENDFYTQLDPTPLNDLEDFEDEGFLPGGWSTVNADALTTWSEVTVIGADSNPTRAAYMDNFNYSTTGEHDVLLTEVYDLGGTNLSLTFDVAKAHSSATNEDVLRVEISTDCFATRTVIYEKTGFDLSTVPGYVPFTWTPAFSGHWRNEVLDLNAYQNQTVQIRFVNVNNGGNSTYIDNVNITGVLSTRDDNFDSNFSLFPNPTSEEFIIQSRTIDVDQIEIYDLLGKRVKSLKVENNTQNIPVNIQGLPSGVYVVRLESEIGTFFKKIVKSE